MKKFVDATNQGVALLNAKPAVVQEHISKYTLLPIYVVRGAPLPKLRAEVTDRDLQNWVAIMTDQGMLRTKLDVGKLRFG